MSQIVVTAIPVSPEDLGFWHYDGQDPHEYLTILDSIGDFVRPDAAASHIHPDLAGPWALWQVLFFSMAPPPDMATALGAAARRVGLDRLADCVEAALPEIARAPDPETAFERLEEALFTGDGWTDPAQPLAAAADALARHVAAHLPRRTCASRADWDAQMTALHAAIDQAPVSGSG